MKLITTHEGTNAILLHSSCERVDNISTIQDEIKWMRRYLNKNPGYGVAAPQFSILKRFFLMKQNQQILNVINPTFEILDESKISIEEHCFSCPGIARKIPRYRKIVSSYINESGKYIKREFSGLNSIIFQHEFDHLNGRLISDFLS